MDSYFEINEAYFKNKASYSKFKEAYFKNKDSSIHPQDILAYSRINMVPHPADPAVLVTPERVCDVLE